MREVCVERDGGCLFRSLAVALFHQIYQINLGKGCLWGREKTVRQVAHNVVARWVRTLVVASLAGMATADPHVRLGNLNFFEMAENLFSFLQAYPKDKHVDPRVLRAEKRALAPQAPTGMFGGPGHSTVYAPENVRGDVVSLSGRYAGESHVAYCKRMLRPREWGGESELFVASKVFGVRIIVWGEDHCVLAQYGEKSLLPLHVRLEEEHYDAYIA